MSIILAMAVSGVLLTFIVTAMAHDLLSRFHCCAIAICFSFMIVSLVAEGGLGPAEVAVMKADERTGDAWPTEPRAWPDGTPRKPSPPSASLSEVVGGFVSGVLSLLGWLAGWIGQGALTWMLWRYLIREAIQRDFGRRRRFTVPVVARRRAKLLLRVLRDRLLDTRHPRPTVPALGGAHVTTWRQVKTFARQNNIPLPNVAQHLRNTGWTITD